jgi:primosomal replication protein N
METQNKVYLCGLVISSAKGNDFYGEDFCDLQLSVKRLSSIVDTIPITVPKELVKQNGIKLGSKLAVRGELRSYNKIEGGRSKLLLSVFVTEITPDFDETNPNTVELAGYICKTPIYRTTPFNREIADILIASNRGLKSDYLPAIAWGHNARFAKSIAIGEQINISGRIQSREYQKRLENGQTETRTAYEISINQISRVNSQPNDADLRVNQATV